MGGPLWWQVCDGRNTTIFSSMLAKWPWEVDTLHTAIQWFTPLAHAYCVYFSLFIPPQACHHYVSLIHLLSGMQFWLPPLTDCYGSLSQLLYMLLLLELRLIIATLHVTAVVVEPDPQKVHKSCVPCYLLPLCSGLHSEKTSFPFLTNITITVPATLTPGNNR